MIVEPWIDHPNVTAVIWAGLPGQESGMPLLHTDSFHCELIVFCSTTSTGNALRDVLYGNWNPSGKLAYPTVRNVSGYNGNIVAGNDPDGTLMFLQPLTRQTIF